MCNESGPSLCLNHPCMSYLSFEALGQHFHSKLKIIRRLYVPAGGVLSSNFICECWKSFFSSAEHILTFPGTGDTGATDGRLCGLLHTVFNVTDNISYGNSEAKRLMILRTLRSINFLTVRSALMENDIILHDTLF